MKRITIRPLKPEGYDQVSRIHRQGIVAGDATLETRCPSFSEWDRSHLPQCRIVAVSVRTILGWAALCPVVERCIGNGVAEVELYVDEEYRRAGVGALLLREMVARSEQAGFWTLQSGLFFDNAAGIGLHEKCGFRIVGFRERVGRDRKGKWRTTVLMERRSPNIN